MINVISFQTTFSFTGPLKKYGVAAKPNKVAKWALEVLSQSCWIRNQE